MTTTATSTEPGEMEGLRLLRILNPRDGSFVGAVEEADRDEVEFAVARAKESCAAWRRTPAADRGAALLAAADHLERAADELAALNERETGKTRADARGGVLAGVATLRQYAEVGPLHRGHSLLGSAAAWDWTVPEPHGVVAAITPWNDPVAVACGLLGAGLVMGNAVVHKPSERCPHTGIRLGELLAEAFPPGVLLTVTGGARTGALLTEQPDVAVVAHVGSTAAGERITRVAALTGAHVIRENGGNDVLIVDSDVDPAWAASQAALGSFANAGQICTSVERILVHERVADDFTAALVVEAEAWTKSDRLGPLVDERMRGEVDRQVQAAVEQGATILTGGFVPAGSGSWYPATVVSGCRTTSELMTEETFGPVAPIHVVRSFEEAMDECAKDRYGLAATVLTGSMEHAARAAHELSVGTVKINAVFGGAPGGSAQPRGASGRGFGYGPELLDEMSLVKVIHQGVPVLREPQ